MSRARDLADGTFSGAVVAASADFTGTVEAADLSDGTTTVGMEYVTNGSAKAWVSAEDDASIEGSLNVSSGTDHGTGDYSYALTSSFLAELSFAMNATTRTTTVDRIANINAARATANILAVGTGDAGTNTDTDQIHYASAFGDLA